MPKIKKYRSREKQERQAEFRRVDGRFGKECNIENCLDVSENNDESLSKLNYFLFLFRVLMYRFS